jgi:hypothetical protein
MSMLCVAGHYCVDGTRVQSEYPCPAGTFNNITGLAAATDCFDCLGKSLLIFLHYALYSTHSKLSALPISEVSPFHSENNTEKIICGQ